MVNEWIDISKSKNIGNEKYKREKLGKRGKNQRQCEMCSVRSQSTFRGTPCLFV